MIKAIAIDDEPIALDIISRHAEKVPFLQLCKTFVSATVALNYLNTEAVDVVFLDINMPDVNGLEFAKLANPSVQLIFTTAHADYAVNGFDLAIADFLLKPINFSRFLQACNRAQSKAGDLKINSGIAKDSIYVKDGYHWVRINFATLMFVKAEDNYINLVQHQQHTLTRMTMNEIAGKLPVGSFIRVHKSYIVNVAFIEKIEAHQLLVAGVNIPVSQAFRENVKNLL